MRGRIPSRRCRFHRNLASRIGRHSARSDVIGANGKLFIAEGSRHFSHAAADDRGGSAL